MSKSKFGLNLFQEYVILAQKHRRAVEEMINPGCYYRPNLKTRGEREQEALDLEKELEYKENQVKNFLNTL